jgi:hypothetical protein
MSSSVDPWVNVRDGSADIKSKTGSLSIGIDKIRKDSIETSAAAAELRDRQKAVSDRLGDIGNETRKLEKSSAQLENEVGRFKVDSISET